MKCKSKNDINIFNLLLLFSLLAFAIISCVDKDSPHNRNARPDKDSTVMIKEKFLTRWYEFDNIDSPAFWSNSENNWIIATAKESDKLFIYDASNGKDIKQIGNSGSALGEFKRPNGILVLNNFLFVVERDNHRVQVLELPDFKPLLTFGDSLLIRPYSISAFEKQGKIKIYITDNYENQDGTIPSIEKLGERVKVFEMELSSDIPNVDFIKSFGETSGKGVLQVVESIHCDNINNVILIAEEDESQNILKIYDLEGNFLNQTFGKNHFHGQIEGIALLETSADEGYWIITDQSETNNIFNIFDRKGFTFIGAFQGQFTLNTDGVALTKTEYSNFPKGAFFACNDDGGISAFCLEEIMKIIK